MVLWRPASKLFAVLQAANLKEVLCGIILVIQNLTKHKAMSNKSNSNNVGVDGSKPKHKGEIMESRQKGAPSVSKKGSGKHFKDNSGSEAIKAVKQENTTKKQQNSI